MQKTSFNEKLAKYARLAVRVGVNLQPGQRLLIKSQLTPHAKALAEEVAKEAYEAGASFVDVTWTDPEFIKLHFEYATKDTFSKMPKWSFNAVMEHVENKDAILNITSEDPDLLKGQDPELLSAYNLEVGKNKAPYIEEASKSSFTFSTIAAPVAGWAARVFPDLPSEQQEMALWDAIFTICGVNTPDPVAAWKKHGDEMSTVAKYLNNQNYKALHYLGPGTDLTVSLAKGHLWRTGGANWISTSGIPFSPNIPTEEIWTTPHREKIDGVISGTKPLPCGGSVIEDFSFTFKDGIIPI